MATDKKAISVYVDPALYAKIEAAARGDGRSVSNWVERALSLVVGTSPSPAAHRQLDITEAIAAAVKRGPVVGTPRKPRHK